MEDKYWKQVFAKIKDEIFRADVENSARLLMSLSQHFKIELDKEGKKVVKSSQKDALAKRTINFLLDEEIGHEAFFALKEYVKTNKLPIFTNKTLEDQAKQAIDVCRYFMLHKGIVVEKKEDYGYHDGNEKDSF